ncbi:hypothetical protein FOZ63_019492 [Perkinsus olseni]|uniref:Uncharacterized protein n=1 Tax=Perkinsus olseni TaxID=32597 RepID=A0A7J6ULZ3_PEROL|nr:hypothetical protein FOZ63_019492 [Perkinsus olseni]
MHTAAGQRGCSEPSADSRAEAARTLASLIVRTCRGAPSEDDDETLKSILAKHPDLLTRRGSTRGSISTSRAGVRPLSSDTTAGCSDAESASQLDPATNTPSKATERAGLTSSSNTLRAPPRFAARRRSSVPDMSLSVNGGGVSVSQAALGGACLTAAAAAGTSGSEYAEVSTRRSSAVTFVSESSNTIPCEGMRDFGPFMRAIPLFDTSGLERMVQHDVNPAVRAACPTTTDGSSRGGRRGSTLSIISDGDESAGPAASPVEEPAPAALARRGSLFSVDPTEILGMTRTPCFATSPSDAELFKNSSTPIIPRHLVTPCSGRSHGGLQVPTPKSPNVEAGGWDMSSLTKPEAALMLQSLLEAASLGAEPDSRDITNVLIGQLVRAHPELVAPASGIDATH